MTDRLLPHWQDDSVRLFHADCLDVLRALPDNSVDSAVTDPPYGLEFMGKDWDAPWKTGDGFRRNSNPADVGRDNVFGRQSARGPEYIAGRSFQHWCEHWATECLRVLKPGGHMLAFGGTRTWHRLACAVEDAGFEVRDGIAWLYGSGFPKSLDVSKAIDKAAGAERDDLGPGQWAHVKAGGTWNGHVYGAEPVHGGGPRATAPATDDARRWQGWGTALKPAFEPVVVARKPLAGTVAANVTTWGTGALNIDRCRVAHDRQSAAWVEKWGGHEGHPAAEGWGNVGAQFGGSSKGRWPANVVLSDDQAAALDAQSGKLTSPAPYVRSTEANNRDAFGANAGRKPAGHQQDGYGDAGGASRFFPTFRYEPKAPTHERPRVDGEAHATVKPLDLMRWLVRLVTPPGGTVLEPFAGSGTTAEACIVEGFRCIAIEREAAYLPLIVARLSKPIQPDLFGGVA